jgi:hypothetical protein
MNIKFYVLDELDIVNAFVCQAVSKRAPIQYLGSDVDDDIIEECKRNTHKVNKPGTLNHRAIELQKQAKRERVKQRKIARGA